VIYDYAKLKDLAQQMGRKVTDLIALSRNHDPFYVGTTAHVTNGKWFAELWQRFDFTDGIHIRRMHYLIVSQKEPVLLPNRSKYENTEQCWGFLADASENLRLSTCGSLWNWRLSSSRTHGCAVLFSTTGAGSCRRFTSSTTR
jgi:hypothetical protein